jgi:hypothetical protein
MNTFREGDAPKKPPKHLLTSKEAEEQLQPYKSLLEECIQHGWDAWEKDYKHKRHILSARSRSAIVFDEIVFHAESKFAGLAGVTPKRHRNTFLLYIGNTIVIRFKKMGKNGKCSSIATRQQVLFQLQIELPGMEKGTMLQAGYSLDDMQHHVVRKMIACQFSNRVLWTIDLVSDEREKVSTIPPAPTPEPSKGPRFAVKPEAEKESQKRKPKKRSAEKE